MSKSTYDEIVAEMEKSGLTKYMTEEKGVSKMLGMIIDIQELFPPQFICQFKEY